MSVRKQVVLASYNKHKLEELRLLLQKLPIEVLPFSRWQIGSVEETGATFVENALIKARHACSHTGLPAIADDSGLVVPSLQGEPGIRSAGMLEISRTMSKTTDSFCKRCSTARRQGTTTQHIFVRPWYF